MPDKIHYSRREVLHLMGAAAVAPPILPLSDASSDAFPVAIQIDARQTRGELRPIWRFYGCDEPNYTYTPHGKKLLAALGDANRHAAYFRTHNLLTTGDGTPALKWGSTNAYTEDAFGNPIYDWTIVDRILEAGLEHGVKPYVQIGFMPEALSTKPEPYRHHWKVGDPYDEIYTGWAYPPKDYPKWGELAYQLTKHSVEKYGRAEVETWYWEVWNEPNIGYWQGTPAEYYKLYDYAVAGVRRALPTARVGGAEIAGGPGGTALRRFLDHCAHGTNAVTGQIGSPLDFISFHAKGSPKLVDGHVRMGLANQLGNIDDAAAVIADFPEFKDKPIIIGESDPDGCAACRGPQLDYRNGTLYPSYTAATLARAYEIADKHGVNLEGAITWAFQFEDQPLFGGLRQLSTDGIGMPILNIFRMLGQMGGQRLTVESSADAGTDAVLKSGVRGTPDVYALAGLEEKKLSVLVWHYHDDDIPGPAAAITLTLSRLPAIGKRTATLHHYRIDADHSNAFTAWKKMGSPAVPTVPQYRQLDEASQLELLHAPENVRVENGSVTLSLDLPRQAVSLLVLEWDRL